MLMRQKDLYLKNFFVFSERDFCDEEGGLFPCKMYPDSPSKKIKNLVALDKSSR